MAGIRYNCMIPERKKIMTNTRIENILNSVSTIDSFTIKYDDGESVIIKYSCGDLDKAVMIIDYDKPDEEIRDFIISESCRALALHIRIHG